MVLPMVIGVMVHERTYLYSSRGAPAIITRIKLKAQEKKGLAGR
jgi:hypothetical protein